MGDLQHLANFLLFGYQIQEVYPLILPQDEVSGFVFVQLWSHLIVLQRDEFIYIYTIAY